MNNLTNQYQNYRNQLSGMTNIQEQIDAIKGNIVSQHVQTFEDIKDKYDKVKEIGEEAAGVLGTFRLGQKFKTGVTNKFSELKDKLSGKVDEIKDKGQDLLDSAQNKVDNVVNTVRNQSDEIVNQGADALERAQGTMADLTNAGNTAVESAKASLSDLVNVAEQPNLNETPVSEQIDFPAIETEMQPMVSKTGGITMEELSQQFPAETLERPDVMGGGRFNIGFQEGEEPLMVGGAPAPEEIRGSLPTRTFVSNDAPVGSIGGSGATHSQPEVAPVESVENEVADYVPEKTLGLFGRLRAGLFSGRAPIQQTFPTIGTPEEVGEQLKSAGADLAGEVGNIAKTGAEELGTGVAEAATETAGEAVASAGEGLLAGALGAIPGVGEALALGASVAGLIGETVAEGQEQKASMQNPLTKTNFSQFNVIPTISSLASQPTTPGIF